MNPRRRLLVIQHEDACPVAMVEPWLAKAGLDCDVLAAHEGRAIPAALGHHAGLIVLGGRMSSHDDRLHRWLVPTKALVAVTVAGGRPFLGICLGHQIAALALGGRVAPNPNGPMRVVARYAPTEEGTGDELLSALTPGQRVVHWNTDVVTQLPRRSRLLARAPDGTVAAARFGRRAWGVQFHPEVTLALARGWSVGPDAEATQAGLAELEQRESEVHRAGEALLRRFGRIVAAS